MSDRLENYVSTRLKPQSEWLEKAAARAKRRHGILVTLQLCTTAAIPAANIISQSTIASTILAGFATIVAGLLGHFGMREDWLRYRKAVSALEALRARFDTRLPPFDGEDRDIVYIESCEEILGGEASQWETQLRQRPLPKRKADKKDDDDDD